MDEAQTITHWLNPNVGVTPVSAKETSMITVFSKDHHLHFGKYELIDGKFVTPFEHAEPIPGPLTDN